MKRHVFVALVVAFGVGMIALGGQKLWEKKEFPDWSKKEIRQMFTKSPWARSVTIRLGGMQPSKGSSSTGVGSRMIEKKEELLYGVGVRVLRQL